MNIYRVLVYSNPNIGIYAQADDSVMILPPGYPKGKSHRLASLLGVTPQQISIAGTRLIGPLLVMNGHGVLVSKLADDGELSQLRDILKDRVVERFLSKNTAVGNLILANDKGAIASERLSNMEIAQIRDVLDVEVVGMSISGYHQVGSVAIANNSGALLHPLASDDELSLVMDAMKLNDVDRGTVNGGVPFISSGIVVNDKAILVGSETTGPELFMIGKVFKAD